MRLGKNYKIGKVLLSVFVISIILLSIIYGNVPNNTPIIKHEEFQGDISPAQSDYDTMDWIENGNFSKGTDNWTSSIVGNQEDINMNIGSGVANYTLNGDKQTVSFDSAFNDGTWHNFSNGIFRYPTVDQITSSGLDVYHRWDEDTDQTHNYPSVHWKKNVSMGIDMSEYNITSATLDVKFSASVSASVDAPGDIDSRGDGSRTGNWQYSIYDFVEFYVEISDIYESNPYRVAYNKTRHLGNGTMQINTKSMESLGTEKDLISALNLALGNHPDHSNFNVTMGIDIYCEDNDSGNDVDQFDTLLIESWNLTITYEKKINQLTTASWDQDKADKILNTWEEVHNATFNFKYKLGGGTWPTSSPNSELRIRINGNLLAETINLKDSATTSFKDAKSGGVDVTSFVEIDKHLNVSIELYIGDEFTLDKLFNITIDNVSLIIEYEKVPSDVDFKLWLDGEDKTTDKSTAVYWRDNVSIALEYKNDTSGNFIPTATVSINGSGISELLNEVPLQNYTIQINSTDLSFGNNYLTIEASKKDYSTLSVPIKIIVVDRNANISQIYLDNSLTKTITKNSGELLPINITYEDVATTNPISGATVKAFKGETELGTFDPWQTQYNYTLNTTDLDLGVNFVSVRAEQTNYTTESEILTIVVDATATNYTLHINGTSFARADSKYYAVETNKYLNFSLEYNVSSGNFIPGAEVSINGSSISELLEDNTYNNYTVEINTKDLNQGVNFLTIYAQASGYQPQSISVTIDIVQRQTNISLYVNNSIKYSDEAIIELAPLTIDEWVNLTIYYEDINALPANVSGATVNFTGADISYNMVEIGYTGNYSLRLNASDNNLNWGVNYLTITAQKSKFAPQTITLKVEIVVETTNYSIEVDGEDKTSISAQTIEISKLWNEYIDLTFIYRDKTDDFIPFANVSIEGIGYSKNFTQESSPDRYNLTIRTIDLGVGVFFLTLTAEKTNYEVQTIIFKIEVSNRPTALTLYVNGEPETIDKSLTINWNETINIVVYYNDTALSSIVSGAIVDINGSGLSEILSPGLDRYEYSFNSLSLGVGTHYLTIEAERTNYTSQTIVLKVQVTIRDTTFKTYINGIDKTIEQSYKTSYSESITITVVYNDTTLSEFIVEATVSVNGTSISSLISKVGEAYQITINSATLGTGISFLTIDALKDNYESQSLVLTIDVIERTTEFYIEINNINKTLDKSIEVPIRSVINITVSYTDQNTGSFISGATVSLIGENISVTLTENATLQLYSVLVNSTELDIGVRFLTVTAQKANYESYSARLKVQVNRIRTNITIESGNATINTLPGESITISVSLHDLDYGGTIENATVTYSADFGQGELLDPDGDGIFEAVLTNVPEGTYQITITVYADDDYAFERIRLTLSAIRPPENVLLFQVLTVVGIGAAIGVGGYLIAYQKVLKFPVPVRKVHKFKKSLKKKKSPSIEIFSSQDALEANYKEELGKVGKLIEEREKLKAKDKLKEIKLPEQRESPTDDSRPLDTLDKINASIDDEEKTQR